MPKLKLTPSQIKSLKRFRGEPGSTPPWMEPWAYGHHKNSAVALWERKLIEAHPENQTKIYWFSCQFRITDKGLEALKEIEDVKTV